MQSPTTNTNFSLLALTLVALLAGCAGLLNAEQPSGSYRVTIESGRIVVTDAKNGAYMGGTACEPKPFDRRLLHTLDECG
jgi:uncharacterized protein YceK